MNLYIVPGTGPNSNDHIYNASAVTHIIENERPQNIMPSTNYICFQMISKEKELNLCEWEAKRYEADDRRRKQGLKRLFHSLKNHPLLPAKHLKHWEETLMLLPSYPSDVPQHNHRAREELSSNVNYDDQQYKHKSNMFSLASQPQKQGRTTQTQKDDKVVFKEIFVIKNVAVHQVQVEIVSRKLKIKVTVAHVEDTLGFV